MPDLPPISDAEWDIMKILWDRDAWLSAADIVDPVTRDRGVNHRTVRTLLARLVRKGAVETRPDGPAYLYRAKVSRDAVVRRETRSFLARVFDGDAAPALVHFIRAARLTPREIDELKAILDQEKKP